jgi:hypothetical protein
MAIREKTGEPEALCPYLTEMERAKKAQIVLTTKASVLNGSKLLSNFDIIALDENSLPHLIENITIDRGITDEWLQNMDKQSDTERHPARQVVRLLQRAIETPAAEPEKTAERRRLIPALKRLAEQGGLNLSEIIGNLAGAIKHRLLNLAILEDKKQNQGQDNTEYNLQKIGLPGSQEAKNIGGTANMPEFDYEKSFTLLDSEKKIHPMRSSVDLIGIIQAELGRPEGADTRAWITAEGKIELYLPRENIIEIIHGKGDRKKPITIFMDATPSPLLKVMFPEIREKKITVPEFKRVRQYADHLFTPAALANPDKKLLSVVAAEGARRITETGATQPALFTHKVRREDLTERISASLPPGITIQPGHYGRDTKGLNAFINADYIAIVGHYMPPLDEITAQIEAIRFSPTPVDQTGDEIEIRPYNYTAPDGTGRTFAIHRDRDPLKHAVTTHSRESTILQAIGRGRAALRSAENPLIVDIFGSLPLTGVKIDELVTLGQPAERKICPNLAAVNTKRRQPNVEKIEAALASPNPPKSIHELAEVTGIRSDNLRRYNVTFENPAPADTSEGYPIPSTLRLINTIIPSVEETTQPLKDSIRPESCQSSAVVATFQPAIAQGENREDKEISQPTPIMIHTPVEIPTILLKANRGTSMDSYFTEPASTRAELFPGLLPAVGPGVELWPV